MTNFLDVGVVMAFILILLMLVLLYFIEKKCFLVCIRNIPEPLPGEGQEDVWSISIPETTELPSYEELQANPDQHKRPPGYWTLFPYKIYYDQPVITETL